MLCIAKVMKLTFVGRVAFARFHLKLCGLGKLSNLYIQLNIIQCNCISDIFVNTLLLFNENIFKLPHLEPA